MFPISPPKNYDFEKLFNREFGIIKEEAFKVRVEFSGWAARYVAERICWDSADSGTSWIAWIAGRSCIYAFQLWRRYDNRLEHATKSSYRGTGLAISHHLPGGLNVKRYFRMMPTWMILRILGDSDFVESVLEAAQETMERKYHLRVSGYDFGKAVNRAAQLFDMKTPRDFVSWQATARLKARSLLCC